MKERIHLKGIQYLICFLFMIWSGSEIYGQRTSVSTNLLEWGILTPNVGVELRSGQKSSIALDVSGCPWRLSKNLSFRQISIRPTYKYWFKQAFYAHYIGIDLLYSAYDIHLKKKFYDGNIIALGIGYGYSFILNERLNLIPGIGIGVGYNHSRNQTVKSGIKPVLTQAAITLQYVIR